MGNLKLKKFVDMLICFWLKIVVKKIENICIKVVNNIILYVRDLYDNLIKCFYNFYFICVKKYYGCICRYLNM